MKKIITIVLLTLSLLGNAQSFDSMFLKPDTMPDGSIALYAKNLATFVNQNDTIYLCPILMFYPGKDTTTGMNIHGFWIYAKSYPENIELVMRNKTIGMVKSLYSYDLIDPTNAIYTAKKTSKKDLIDFVEGINMNGKVYSPIEQSRSYLIKYIKGFDNIRCDWYE